MMSDKPFDKLRPRTQQAIVNEVRRKSEGKYPEPDVDAALRALYPDIPSPHEKFMKSPLDRATGAVFERVFHRWPLAFLRGITEIGTSIYDMARTYEVERRHYPGSASTYPVNKFGIQILIENLIEEHQWPKELKDAEQFMYQMLREYGPYSTEFDMARRMFKWDHAEWVRETPRPTRDAIFHEMFAKYTSVDEFLNTLDNRPDEIVSDLAGLKFLKGTKIGKILDKANPENVLETVLEARAVIKQLAGKSPDIERVNNLLSEIEGDLRNTDPLPPRLRRPQGEFDPATDLVSGRIIDDAQFEAWDADDNIYYRITNESRLGQETSFAVAESEGIHRIIEDMLQDFQNFEGFEPSFVASDFLDDDGYFMSYNKAKQKLGASLNPDEYEYWSRYEEIAWERFGLEIVPQDDTLMESLPLQLRRDSRFQNPPRFRYGGVNGVLTRDEIIEYVQESDWHYFLQKEDDPTVIQVLRGDGIRETHDNDGWVVVPAETEAVFDVSVLWKR